MPLDSDTITAAGFEVLPPMSGSVHSVHGDVERTAELMALVTDIANERGLDSQNYQCKGCGRNIGGSSVIIMHLSMSSGRRTWRVRGGGACCDFTPSVEP